MRRRYCVLVVRGDEVVAVGSFGTRPSAEAYAATLPAGEARGVARIATTDMFRVETGNGLPARRQPANRLAEQAS